MNPLAVHLGPGPLGLGLVVDVLLAAGFDVCLIGRPDADPPEQTEYWLAFADTDLGLQLRQVRWAGNPDHIEDLDPAVAKRLATDPELLITCALGAKASQRAELLSRILELRPPDSRTLLLACENEADPIYAQVATHSSVHYCACVVDRICNWNEPQRDAENRKRLLVHSVAQWVVRQAPWPSRLLDRLGSAREVLVVEVGLTAHKLRKLGAVNGVHLVLALIARQHGADELPLTDQRREAFIAIAAPVIEVILETVARRWPHLPADPAWATDRIRAFCESPDSATRILRERLVRSDLRELMGRMDSRVGELARLAHQQGLDCNCFAAIAYQLIETLEDRSAYLEEPEGAEATETVDREVVERFAAFTDGWMGSVERARAVRRLDHALAVQRV